jgi:hypothetical protein
MGIDVRLEKSLNKIDLVYIPKQRKAQLPGEDSRWLPREILLNIDNETLGRVTVPEDIDYYYLEEDILNEALDNNFAVRASTNLGPVDLYISYFYGASNSPEIGLETTITSGPGDPVTDSNVGLQPIYYTHEQSSLGLVLTLDHAILRFETAYSNTIDEDDFLTPWSWKNAASLETQLNFMRYTITLLIEGYYAKNGDAASNLFGSNSRAFDEALLVGLRWPFSTSTHLQLTAFFDLASEGNSQSLEYNFKIHKTLGASLFIDLIGGNEESLIGTYRNNDRAGLLLKYYF